MAARAEQPGWDRQSGSGRGRRHHGRPFAEVGAGNGSSQEDTMAVAKVSEISSTSAKSFEDAVQQGISRASATLRHIRSAWVKEQRVRCEEGRIVEYQVNLKITFVLD
jgi:flavin-binding protein dodecin